MAYAMGCCIGTRCQKIAARAGEHGTSGHKDSETKNVSSITSSAAYEIEPEDGSPFSPNYETEREVTDAELRDRSDSTGKYADTLVHKTRQYHVQHKTPPTAQYSMCAVDIPSRAA